MERNYKAKADDSFSLVANEDKEMMMRKKKGSNGNGNMGKKREVKLSTEPQSVAARERRHRIRERFKILQSLIPGGTKMDTVSMLEEAIHYVKFLKAQILWLHQAMIINHHHHVVHDHDIPICHHHDNHHVLATSNQDNEYHLVAQMHEHQYCFHDD